MLNCETNIRLFSMVAAAKGGISPKKNRAAVFLKIYKQYYSIDEVF